MRSVLRFYGSARSLTKFRVAASSDRPYFRPPTKHTVENKRKMSSSTGPRKLTIAIEGCCHGELDDIYGTLQHLEKAEGKKIDLLISCGDFQAVRNMDDLETMACPPKYRTLNTFYKYYSGEAKAPYPTLFIGGNHEAANYLWELYYGGWAAPNIYFMGFSGCVKFGGVRIAGLSGIYKQGDYLKGHDEQLPYSESSMRSMYHIRDFEVYRLMQMKKPIDIFLTHDWPKNIANYGNKEALLSRKKFLRAEIEDGSLGSPPAADLLHTLQPKYWFSAHMHTKFPAVVPHPGGASTRFLALDKCLPGRDFLQVIEVDATGPLNFEYDEEWLSIMRSTHSTVNLNRRHRPLPGMGALRKGADPADVDIVREALKARGGAEVAASSFVQTAAPAAALGDQSGFKVQKRGRMPNQAIRNPQTEGLLEMLQLPYNLDHSQEQPGAGSKAVTEGPFLEQRRLLSGQGAGLASDLQVLPQPPIRLVTDEQVAAALANPEEIDVGDEDDDEGPEEGLGRGGSIGKELEKDPMFQPL